MQIKCNRLRPACEACQVFQCPCIYGMSHDDMMGVWERALTSVDAVPKKRGPKTDVLEALLKRVDGLEAKLKEKNATESPTTPTTPGMKDDDAAGPSQDRERSAKRLALDTKAVGDGDDTIVFSPIAPRFV
jgi:hypothetical protein